MKLPCLAVFAMVGLAGCASTDSVSVTRDASTGSVVIAYDTADLKNPKPSAHRVDRMAGSQCSLLGYAAVEPVAAVNQQCSSEDASGACNLWQVEKSYSCTGNFMARDADTLRPVADNGVMRAGQGF